MNTISVVADSCVALDDWLQNPMADSAIENIIPRLDNETSQKIYSTTRKVTYGVVNVINSDIINVTNVNMPPSAGPLYYNQSGPLMPLLCNPLHPDLSDRKCLPGEVTFDDASQASLLYSVLCISVIVNLYYLEQLSYSIIVCRFGAILYVKYQIKGFARHQGG